MPEGSIPMWGADNADSIDRLGIVRSGDVLLSFLGRKAGIWVSAEHVRCDEPCTAACLACNFSNRMYSFPGNSMHWQVEMARAFSSWSPCRSMPCFEHDFMAFWHERLPVCIVTYDVGLRRKASLVLFVKKFFPHLFLLLTFSLSIDLALRDLFGIINNGRLTLRRVW